MILGAVYNIAITAALPFLPLRLWWRGRSEPLYRHEISQRFGFYGDPIDMPIIWVHAVSLGETRAAQPLIQALRRRFPEHRILTTHMTATGRSAAAELYPDALHAWLPYDHPCIVRRFLAQFRPRLGVVMETEVWPNLIAACTRATIPLVLANARLSDRSARGYARVGALSRKAFGGFDAIAAQTQADADRIAGLGGREPIVTGNVKFDVNPPPESAMTARVLRGMFGERNVFLAASTRDGEEALILDALARHDLSDTLIVIVPRHPQRFDAVADLIRSRGHVLVRRSEARPVPSECCFFLGDSMGELAAYYRACDVAFVGGSLVPTGGQNLIEACDAGVPVLIGPSRYNFAEAAENAVAAGAARCIATADELLTAVAGLLTNHAARTLMGERASMFCAAHRGATARTLALCERYIH